MVIFISQVTFKALQQRTLRLSVFDVDRSKKHRLIGHAMYPLKDLDYETHQKVVMWLDLEKEVNEVRIYGLIITRIILI